MRCLTGSYATIYTVPMNVNPVKSARRALHLTQERLSAITGVGTDTIVRAEQGLYPTVPPALQAYLKVDTTAYRAWQREKRQTAFGVLVNCEGLGGHPLDRLLETSNLSEIQFCKLFCLPRAVIYKFLHQPHLCATPPVGLLEAFADAGYSEDWVTTFTLRWVAFKRERLNKAS